jgi:hypothetical protein
MIEASTLHDMSYVIAVTGKRLNSLDDIHKPGPNAHKNHEEILSTG